MKRIDAAPPAFGRSIIERTAALRMPAIYQWPEIAEQGGLVGYGPRIVQLYRDIMSRPAAYVDRILKGEKPGDLPVQTPSKYELIVNLKTARVLGLTVPQTLLARADEVIE